MSSFAILTVCIAALLRLCAAKASDGCLNVPGNYANKNFYGSIESGGLNRTFLLNFPSNYGRSALGSPLIVAYHGSLDTAAYIQTQSQFSNATLNPNAVVVYPQGVGEHWQGSPLAEPGVNDIQFTSDLLAYLANKYCLDYERFYASGHSNGGGFVNTIACWPGLSGQFAAFAPMSFAVYNGSQGPNGVCKPDHAITPILEMHGYSDPVIPYKGGSAQGWTVPPVLTTMTDWVIRNGGSSGYLSATTLFPGKVTLYQNIDHKVQQWTFQAMGHSWPSNTTVTPNGDFKTPVEGTAVIMQWFNANS